MFFFARQSGKRISLFGKVERYGQRLHDANCLSKQKSHTSGVCQLAHDKRRCGKGYRRNADGCGGLIFNRLYSFCFQWQMPPPPLEVPNWHLKVISNSLCVNTKRKMRKGLPTK